MRFSEYSGKANIRSLCESEKYPAHIIVFTPAMTSAMAAWAEP